MENIRYLNDTIIILQAGVLKSLRYSCVRYIRHVSIDLYKNFAGVLIRIRYIRKFVIIVLIISAVVVFHMHVLSSDILQIVEYIPNKNINSSK